MTTWRAVAAIVSATASVALVSSPAAAQPPPDPGCEGRFVAYNNQFFNFGSPSGNDDAAAGPGLFFQSETAAHIHADREEACS